MIKWFQAILLPYFTADFPRYQIMDWDLDKGEILKTPKNEFDWLKMISFMKEGTREKNHFEPVKLKGEIFGVFRISPLSKSQSNHDWDLDKGEILKTSWLKMIFFMKEGIHDHFCKVSSDFKPFWQVTIFHTRLPQIPNGLRQG